MKLTKYQQEMLDGKHGEAKAFCMDKLQDFGAAVEAEEMVDLVLTLNGVPIWAKDRRTPEMMEKLAIYDLGHSALYDPLFAMEGAKVADHECTKCGSDPYLMQLDKYEVKDSGPWNFEIPGKGSFKIDEEIHKAYKDGYEKMAEHGWLNWLSCTPYFNTCVPKLGEYCASSESSAACYINTILGGRTNRESAVNTVYCAYTGCLPKYGTMLDEHRAAKCIVEIDDEVRDNLAGAADWAALGACIAEKADNRIMAVLNLPKSMGPTATKQVISCASPGMNDPMMHLMGYTPESPTLEAAFKGKMPKNPERSKVTMDDVVEMFQRLNNIQPAPGPEGAKPVDIVVMGCPHLTFEEIREIAQLVKGKKVKDGVKLWVQTDTPSYYMAHHYGDAKIIEDAGGKIYHQTCMVMNPMRHYPPGLTIATDSFKYCKLGSGFGQKWIFGNPPSLVNAALTGVFTPTARWDYWRKPKEMRQANEKDKPLYHLPGAV